MAKQSFGSGVGRREFVALGAGLAMAAGPRSALDDDGTILVDGRRTFPLVLYQAPQEGLRAAREAGVDIVSCAAKREALDELAAHGLKGWCAVGALGEKLDRSALASKVNGLKDHPALLYWETEDEPSYQWNKPGVARVPAEAIRATYAELKRLDPSRLVYLNHAPTNLVSTLRSYNPGGDLVATDVYPVIPHGIRAQYALWPDGRQGDLLNATIGQVGQYVDKMREVAGPRRAVLMVMQGFAWEMLRKEDDRDASMVLYPTAGQLRFMALQSIVHGANGLVWWGLSYTPRGARLWADLAGVTRMLDGMRGALAGRRRAIKLGLEYHDTGHSLDRGLAWTAKADGAKTLWVAVNEDSNPVEVSVTGLPAEVELVAGERGDRAGGAWRVRLEPFGVAAWRFFNQNKIG